jgi:hypothetical protein
LSKAHASSGIAQVEFKEDYKFSGYSPIAGIPKQVLLSSPTKKKE